MGQKMNDICKCNGEKCKAKKNCKRFACKSVEFQSYEKYYLLPKNKKGRCAMFVEIKNAKV
jgi:hypothetical protein